MQQAFWVVSSPGSKRESDSADGARGGCVGESACALNSGGEEELSDTRNGTVLKGTSETLREAGYTPSSPTRVRLRELESLAQGHVSCAVAFKSSEGPRAGLLRSQWVQPTW